MDFGWGLEFEGIPQGNFLGRTLQKGRCLGRWEGHLTAGLSLCFLDFLITHQNFHFGWQNLTAEVENLVEHFDLVLEVDLDHLQLVEKRLTLKSGSACQEEIQYLSPQFP